MNIRILKKNYKSNTVFKILQKHSKYFQNTLKKNCKIRLVLFLNNTLRLKIKF